jgi:hypothetical protein
MLKRACKAKKMVMLRMIVPLLQLLFQPFTSSLSPSLSCFCVLSVDKAI